MEKIDQSAKTRYSDAELAEFKAIIEEKLAKAKAEYNTLRQASSSSVPTDRSGTPAAKQIPLAVDTPTRRPV